MGQYRIEKLRRIKNEASLHEIDKEITVAARLGGSNPEDNPAEGFD